MRCSLAVCMPLLGAALLAGCEPGRGGASGEDSGTDATSTPPAGVGFRLAGPMEAALLVPVHVNGRGPYDFVLDTGATYTCIDDGVARELGLTADERRMRGMGASGQLRAARVVELDSVRVGGSAAEDVRACILDLESLRAVGSPVHGLLGLSYLKNFRVTLDFERRVLLLE